MAYESRVRVISETNIDSANNTSYITVAFEFRRTDRYYYGYNRTGDAWWSIGCAGQGSGAQYFTYDWNIPQNTWHEVGRWSFTIPHNADGSKAVYMEGYIYFGSGVAPGSLQASANATLTTIPRATSPTLSPATQVIGQNITINLPRASGSFTHNLSYSFGNLSGSIASGASTSATFTLPQSFIEQTPDAVTKTGKIICSTYNGSTLIGTKEVTFTAQVPTNVVPEISNVAISEAEPEIATKFGLYVQNKSRLRIVTSADGAQGSTLSSCRVECNGGIYMGLDIETNTLSSAGTVQVKITVTDSRGRTASASRSVTVYEYFNPNIRTFAAYRSDTSGEEDDEAESAKLVIDFEIAPINNKNEKSYKVQVQKQGETSWTTILSGNAYSYDNTYVKAGTVLDADYSHTVRLTVSDYFMETVAEVEIGTAFTLMDFRHTGRGMAIGKVSQKDALEINMDVEFLKTVKLLLGDEIADVAELLNEMTGNITKLLRRVSMTIELSADYKTSGQGKVPLNKLACSTVTNDELLHENGSIVIGPNVSKVLVSGNMFGVMLVNTSYLWAGIRKNSSDVSIGIDPSNTFFCTVALTPKVIEVSEGDSFYLYKINNEADTIRSGSNTWLTVQVVE